MLSQIKHLIRTPEARRLCLSLAIIAILLTLLVTLLQTAQQHRALLANQTVKIERAVTHRLPSLYDNFADGDVQTLPTNIESWLQALADAEQLEFASLSMGNNLSWQVGSRSESTLISLNLGNSKTLPAAMLQLQPSEKSLRAGLWQAFMEQLLFNLLMLSLAAIGFMLFALKKLASSIKQAPTDAAETLAQTSVAETELEQTKAELQRLQSELEQVSFDRNKLREQQNRYKDDFSRQEKEHSKELEQSMMLLDRAQELMVEQEKMAALGGLVSGLAHELNTPIGVSLTAATMVKNELQQLHQLINGEDPTLEEINTILADTQQSSELAANNIIKASQLVQKFKTVAVAQPLDKQQDLNLLQMVEDLFDSTRLMFKPKEAQIDLNIAPNLEIVCNHSLLTQIVGNLLTNAFNHGFTQDKGNRLFVSAEIENEQLKLIVEDNGPGIRSDVAEHMFEPFYTTNRSKGATGLGLAAAYNATTQLQGTIWFNHHTNLGGAGFVVQFPVQYRYIGDIELYQC